MLQKVSHFRWFSLTQWYFLPHFNGSVTRSGVNGSGLSYSRFYDRNSVRHMIYLLLIALLISHEKICCEWHPLAYTNLIVGYYSDTSTYKIRSRRKKLRHFQKNHFFSHFSRRRSPKENRHLFGEISHNPNLWSFFLWLFFRSVVI